MGKSRLLVVEDDIDIGNMLKIYFSGLDYDVDVAVRGSEALEKTKQVLPHRLRRPNRYYHT
jgi:DNA-binding response OmpR family regulator